MTAASSRRLSPVRGVLLATGLSLVLLVGIEGAARLLVARRGSPIDEAHGLDSELREAQHAEYDADLGWMNQASVRVEDLYGPGTTFTTNSQRLRAPREYSAAVPRDTFRIICLGDSFTMGYGVDDAATFPALLDARPGLEALNMGLGGFGIGQDYLWYLRDGVEFECDLLLFSVIADDFRRAQTSLFQGTHPKPLLELYGDRLEVRNVPVPPRLPAPAAPASWRAFLDSLAITRLIRERRSQESDGQPEVRSFEPLAEHLFRALAETSRERGQEFALVFLPTAGQVQRGETPLAAWLREFSGEAGITFIDMTPEFDPVPTEELDGYFTQGHYSARGNALVARAVERLVDDQFRD